jgi:hypothetical protein
MVRRERAKGRTIKREVPQEKNYRITAGAAQERIPGRTKHRAGQGTIRISKRNAHIVKGMVVGNDAATRKTLGRYSSTRPIRGKEFDAEAQPRKGGAKHTDKDQPGIDRYARAVEKNLVKNYDTPRRFRSFNSVHVSRSNRRK